MTTPFNGDLTDQLLSDPTFQAESPQREIIATLESLTENWRHYVLICCLGSSHKGRR